MKSICICSEKGGVGKTTVAVNLAVSLSKIGYKTLVIDLDQQGNASKYLGYMPDNKLTTADAIYSTIADKEIDYSEIRNCCNNLDFLPASQMLTGITMLMINSSDNNYIIKNMLSNDFYNKYDFVIFDCRTLLDLLVANAINSSNYVIVPVESSIFSFDGLSEILNKISLIKSSTNPDIEILGIVLNKQQRTIVGTSISDSVESAYPDLVFKTKIPFFPAQAEFLILNGVNQTDKNQLRESFDKLVKEMIERVK